MDSPPVVPGDNPVGAAVLRGKRTRARSGSGSRSGAAGTRSAGITRTATRASGRLLGTRGERARSGGPARPRPGRTRGAGRAARPARPRRGRTRGAGRAARPGRAAGPARVRAPGRRLGLRHRHLRSLRSRPLGSCPWCPRVAAPRTGGRAPGSPGLRDWTAGPLRAMFRPRLTNQPRVFACTLAFGQPGASDPDRLALGPGWCLPGGLASPHRCSPGGCGPRRVAPGAARAARPPGFPLISNPPGRSCAVNPGPAR